MGGRIAHKIDSYEIIGTNRSHINILNSSYKPSLIGKAPRQRDGACNPAISAIASNVLDTEVKDSSRIEL